MWIHQLVGFFFVGLVIAIIFGVPYLLLFDGAKKFFVKPLRKRYQGLSVRDVPVDGDVELIYHTYRGFVFWWTQDEHRVYGTPDEILTLLKRLRNWNLTWGTMSCAIIFIPLLAIVNYWSQLRSIRAQQTGHAGLAGLTGRREDPPDTNPYLAAPEAGPPSKSTSGPRPSPILRAGGWFLAGVSVLCVMFGVANFINGRVDDAGGMLLLAMLLFLLGRDYLKSNPPAASLGGAISLEDLKTSYRS